MLVRFSEGERFPFFTSVEIEGEEGERDSVALVVSSGSAIFTDLTTEVFENDPGCGAIAALFKGGSEIETGIVCNDLSLTVEVILDVSNDGLFVSCEEASSMRFSLIASACEFGVIAFAVMPLSPSLTSVA